MGYFSNLAAEYVPYEHDHSYTPPEKELLWRLEELENRLEELVEKGSVYEYRSRFSDNDLRYILPKHFKSTADVEAAIELAISDLADRYGIHMREESAEDIPALDELTGMQITILDLLSVQACREHMRLCKF